MLDRLGLNDLNAPDDEEKRNAKLTLKKTKTKNELLHHPRINLCNKYYFVLNFCLLTFS